MLIKTLPLYLVFFVTNRCNARCLHCFLPDVPDDPCRELSLAEIEKIAPTVGRLQFFLPTGGEPFLREDLPEIIHIFWRETGVRNVGLPTNGILTERIVAKTREILRLCPGIRLGIDISLDGLGPVHDEIRGRKGIFEEAVRTYQELKKLKIHHPALSVDVEATISFYNQDRLDEFYEFLTRELEAPAIFNLTRGTPRDPKAKQVNIDKYEAFARKIEQNIKQRHMKSYDSIPFPDLINAKRIVRSRLVARTARTNAFQVPCMAGRLGGAISASGEVLACELLTDRVLGNLRDFNYDFRKIWSSKKADDIRRWIRRERCFCTYECYHTLNNKK